MRAATVVDSVPARQVDHAQTRQDLRAVLLIGLLSGACYAVVYWSQRAIFLNGLSLDLAGVALRGAPASLPRLRLEAGAYYGSTVVLFALYIWLLQRCRHGGLQDRRVRTAALLIPLVFNITLLFGRPYLSTDMHSYIAHSYLGVTPGSNPYAIPARAVATTPFAPSLARMGWRPVHGLSPYGPLWTQVELLVGRVSLDVPTARWLMKSLVVAASLASAGLIWTILGRVRPADQLLGTLLYLWNPVVVVELAAEGHNDALMIVFVLLSMLLAVHARPGASLVALLLGALAKFIPLILVPAQLVYAWRARQGLARLALQLTAGLLGGIALAALLFRPVWIGPATLDGVREQGRQNFLASTPVTLYMYFQRTRSEPEASRLAAVIADGVFGLLVVIASLQVRDAATLLRACGRIALVFVLIASPSYWPWYVILPIALMALSPQGSFIAMSVVLAFCSRLVAPIDDMVVNGFSTWNAEVWSTTAIGLLLPLLIYLVLSATLWALGRARGTRAPTTTPG